MTAMEYLRATRARELAYAREQYAECKAKRLPGMTAFWRRQMARAYIYWRWVR